MSVVVTVEPTSEPIGLDEVKSHLNVLSNDHDTYIDELIVAARHHCQTYTRQAAMTTTFRKVLWCLPISGVINLEYPPLQTVTSIYYINSSGVSTLLATTEYVVDSDTKPGRIIRAYEKIWPVVRTSGVAAPITVVYVAGHATQAAVPAEFRHAMKMLIGHWWMVREGAAQVNFAEVPHAVNALLAGAAHGEYP